MLEAKCRILSRCYADSSGLLRNGRYSNMEVEREKRGNHKKLHATNYFVVSAHQLLFTWGIFSNPFACWWGFTMSLSQRKTHVNTHARLISFGGSQRLVVWFLPPNVDTCGLAEALCRYFNLSCLALSIVLACIDASCLSVAWNTVLAES